MAHNSSNYSWQHRSPQPLHPSTMNMDQQSFPPPRSLPSNHGYPGHVGYPPHHHSTTPSYYQSGPSSQFVFSQHSGTPQNRHHPRSASIPYSFSGSGTTPNSSSQLQGHHLFPSTSPSYVVSQSEYYLAQGSSMSSNAESLAASPQPHSLMSSSTVYSSPDSSTTSTNPEPCRVISSRPKPQCWEHGCNGREFSTFSNLLRHQREKSGVVTKAECNRCGAVFTRTTARNIHVDAGKCKQLGSNPSGR